MEPEQLHPDDLIGATKLNGEWRLFAGTVAEWILDYNSYDPHSGSPSEDEAFRSGLMLVNETNAAEFHSAMSAYGLAVGALQSFLRKVGPSAWPLYFVVDFDERFLVSGFHEVPVAEYVPDGWRSVCDAPLLFIPDELRGIWSRDVGGEQTGTQQCK